MYITNSPIEAIELPCLLRKLWQRTTDWQTDRLANEQTDMREVTLPNRNAIYRVFRKNCVFSQFTATPPSPTFLWETLKALNAMRVYSHSYWLVIFCTTNSSRVLERERWQTFENSLNNNTILNEHPVTNIRFFGVVRLYG